MIIRILGEGQYNVPDAALSQVNVLDSRLQTALDTGDAAAFGTVLGQLLAAVRHLGTTVPDAVITPSGLILPPADTRLDEVVALLADEGLIPG